MTNVIILLLQYESNDKIILRDCELR